MHELSDGVTLSQAVGGAYCALHIKPAPASVQAIGDAM
jgi:hypothetical protein